MEEHLLHLRVARPAATLPLSRRPHVQPQGYDDQETGGSETQPHAHASQAQGVFPLVFDVSGFPDIFVSKVKCLLWRFDMCVCARVVVYVMSCLCCVLLCCVLLCCVGGKS